MPAKKKASVSEMSSGNQEEMSETKRSFSFPKVKLMLPKTFDYTPLLVLAIIVGAFFLGRMSAQLQYAQSGTAMAPSNGQQAAAGAQQPGQPAQITPGQKVNVANGHFPAMGNTNAKVTVIEFADLRCPFCKQFHDNVFPQLKKDYIDTGKIQFYFRQFPFLGPASNVAADAAECAQDQGKFWQFEDYMYTNQPDESDTTLYTAANLAQVAGNMGMDSNAFANCVTNKTDDARTQQDYTQGQAAGVSGTPTFYINGVQLVGAQPYTAFQSAINAALIQ